MNAFDLVILIFIGLAAYNGWRSGLVRQVVSLAGVFVAYWAAKAFYPMLNPIVGQFVKAPVDPKFPFHNFLSGQLDSAVSFVILFIATFFAIKLAGMLLDVVAKLPGLSFVNRVTGLLLGIVLAVIIAGIVVNVLQLVPSMPMHGALKNSTLAQMLLLNFSGFLPQHL